MLDSSHNHKMNKDPLEKVLYKQVHSLQCVRGVIQVLLLIKLYFSLV